MILFESTDKKIHLQQLSLPDAEYTYFIECNYSKLIMNSTNISFLVSSIPSVSQLPYTSGGSGSRGSDSKTKKVNGSVIAKIDNHLINKIDHTNKEKKTKSKEITSKEKLKKLNIFSNKMSSDFFSIFNWIFNKIFNLFFKK